MQFYRENCYFTACIKMDYFRICFWKLHQKNYRRKIRRTCNITEKTVIYVFLGVCVKRLQPCFQRQGYIYSQCNLSFYMLYFPCLALSISRHPYSFPYPSTDPGCLQAPRQPGPPASTTAHVKRTLSWTSHMRLHQTRSFRSIVCVCWEWNTTNEICFI